jgi:hypothetical protein
MKRSMITVCLVGGIATPLVWTTVGAAYGAEPLNTAEALSTAPTAGSPGQAGSRHERQLLVCARHGVGGRRPGWTCQLKVGLLFECKPRRGHGRVDFFGE